MIRPGDKVFWPHADEPVTVLEPVDDLLIHNSMTIAQWEACYRDNRHRYLWAQWYQDKSSVSGNHVSDIEPYTECSRVLPRRR